MLQFTDAEGRTWKPELNAYAAYRMQQFGGLDIMDIVVQKEGEQTRVAFGQFQTLAYYACEKEANDRGVSEIEFRTAFTWEVLTQAADGLGEMLQDFFRSAPKPGPEADDKK